MESYNKEDRLEKELDEKRQKERANSIRIKIGIIGKVYNIVVYICASPNCINTFKKAARKLIPLDNCIR